VKRFAIFFSLLVFCCQPSWAKDVSPPGAWSGLPMASYSKLDGQSVSRSSTQVELSLNGRDSQLFDISHQYKHSNGDISVSGKSSEEGASITATFGKGSVFGQMHQDGKDYVLTTDQSGQWAVELPTEGVYYNQCGLDDHAANKPTSKLMQVDAPVAIENTAIDSTLDILLIYNAAFAERYPGDLLETRMNHFVEIANQTMANSAITLGIRVVGIEFFDYRNDNSNFDLRNDMSSTLAGSNPPGLEGLRSLRDETGADLVIMFRPHDIETRGSCGIAFFPAQNASRGVNVVSDGMSSWSACLDDVMTHEIGHNLGAAHQTGVGGGDYDPRGAAFISLDQFGTMMGSFGTGKPDRFRGLPIFSNPDVLCGGVSCGSNTPGDLSNNSAVIRDVMPEVIAYRSASSNAPEPLLPGRSTADSDGDGVIDWQDHFPFDSAEQADMDLDGSGDATDKFPTDPAESLDSDADLVGDNADTDDDNDLIADVDDQYPTDPEESQDDDDDGTGNNADVFAQRSSEHADFDQDGSGNNEDDDDDGDGFPELDPLAEDILVISVGNNRVLRFDASSGASRGIEILPEDGLFSFQSDMSYRSSDHTLMYTSSSAIRRINLLNRQTLGTWVPPYEANGGLQLGSGFPTGITAIDGGRLIGTTLMGNTQISLFNGQDRAFPQTGISWGLPAGESPIDIVADGNTAIILGQATRTLYRADSEGTNFLGPEGAEWMQDPHRMALSGDGRLLISDQQRNSVVAVDAQSGEFLEDFIKLAEQGYSNPTGLAVSRAGQLLVASADTNVILSYDVATGEFNGELVSSGQGGLSQPHVITIVPQLVDRLGHDPARVIRPNAGLWFNPASDGRGFDIQVFNNRLSAIWYTYDELGQPTWYITAGDLDGFHFEGDMLLTRLTAEGVFEYENVGRLTLDFTSERLANMQWTIGDDSGGEALQWLQWDYEPASQNFTGLWGRADGPGWGVSLATQGSRSVAIAYIYDDAGEPRWAISDPVDGLPPLELNMNAVIGDNLCPTCTGTPEFQFIPAGEMTMSISESSVWDIDIVFPEPFTQLIAFPGTNDILVVDVVVNRLLGIGLFLIDSTGQDDR
jgi:hypothetical protein